MNRDNLNQRVKTHGNRILYDEISTLTGRAALASAVIKAAEQLAKQVAASGIDTSEFYRRLEKLKNYSKGRQIYRSIDLNRKICRITNFGLHALNGARVEVMKSNNGMNRVRLLEDRAGYKKGVTIRVTDNQIEPEFPAK